MPKLPFNGGLSSGYFARAAAVLPKQGEAFPWLGGVNYILDLVRLSFGGLDTTGLTFGGRMEKKDE